MIRRSFLSSLASLPLFTAFGKQKEKENPNNLPVIEWTENDRQHVYASVMQIKNIDYLISLSKLVETSEDVITYCFGPNAALKQNCWRPVEEEDIAWRIHDKRSFILRCYTNLAVSGQIIGLSGDYRISSEVSLSVYKYDDGRISWRIHAINDYVGTTRNAQVISPDK